MRKTLFSLALAMAVLSSCSSDDIVNNPMNEENHSFPASRSLHENILSFSSEEEYNALLDSLGTLSDEELLQWGIRTERLHLHVQDAQRSLGTDIKRHMQGRI